MRRRVVHLFQGVIDGRAGRRVPTTKVKGAVLGSGEASAWVYTSLCMASA